MGFFLALAAMLAMPAIANAASDGLATQADFELPAQPLATALKQFADQAGIQILFEEKVAEGFRASAVKVHASATEVLNALLNHTDLEFIARGHTVVVRRKRGASSAGDAEHRFVLEEVVVTAQKREERLQDVPISISVLGGNTLDRSSDRGIVEALNRVPGVIAPITSGGGRAGGNPSIVIRGVSAPTVGSATTAYYLDSIPFGRAKTAFVPDINSYDLDRVEVLRGPQGTLYGASALNGVVRILTRDPDLQDFEFKARGSLSGTAHGSASHSGDAAFNVPLIRDRLAARVVLGYQDLGGWIDKPDKADANDTKRSNARMKLAAKPADNFSLGLSGWFSRSDSGAPPFSADGGHTNASVLDESSSTDFDTYGLDLDYDTRFFSIRSATSYIDYRPDNSFDFSAFAANNTIIGRAKSTVFAEELVLHSLSRGRWRWTLGSMYRNAQDDSFARRSLSTVPDIYHTESRSAAIYGELTRVLADGRLEVTGGLRYFRDEVRDWENSRIGTTNGIPPGGLQSIENVFDKTTPRFVVTWHPGQDTTLYASYSQGFRSGVAQSFAVAAAFPNVPPAKPDTLTNYEIGGKAKFGRFTFDTAVYYIDWQDPQQFRVVRIDNLPTTICDNGESISGAGVDLAVAYSPVESLTTGFNYGWNDLTFDTDVYSGNVLLFPKGSRRTNSPKTTAGAFIDYSVPLGGSGSRGRISVSANHVSRQLSNVNPAGVPLMADSMTLVHAGFRIDAPEHWSAVLFVDNATNEKGVLPDTYHGTVTSQYNTVIRPRTHGVQLEYRY